MPAKKTAKYGPSAKSRLGRRQRAPAAPAAKKRRRFVRASPKDGSGILASIQRVASEKLAISLERSLAEEVRRAAERDTAGNVSAWLSEAARDRLRLAAAREALESFEARAGRLTAAELAEADRVWPAD